MLGMRRRMPGTPRRSRGLVVAPAKAGAHTAESLDRPWWQLPSPNDDLWLWAPAFAGATAWMLFVSILNSTPILASASDARTTARHDKNSRGAFRPSYANRSAPREIEGAGKTGCPQHTHGPAQKRMRERALTTGGAAITPAFPAQWFTAYRRSPR